jgi:transcriptional regulator with XRE-family HTH domain
MAIMALRNRPSELIRESRRLSTSMAMTLGTRARAGRTRQGRSQGTIAAEVGCSQTEISRIERGLGARTPLETWIALGLALDQPLAVSFSRPQGEGRDGPTDAGHLKLQEHMLRLAAATGRQGTFELPTRPVDPSRSTDVGIRDIHQHVRILAECWNTIGDLGAAVRATNRKQAEATAPWPDDRITTVWVIRATAANRALLARFPGIVDAAFPGSSRSWIAALSDGMATPPEQPGIVWLDPATGRLTERRRGTMGS